MSAKSLLKLLEHAPKPQFTQATQGLDKFHPNVAPGLEIAAVHVRGNEIQVIYKPKSR